MIRAELLRDQGILVIVTEDPIEEVDFKKFSEEAESFLPSTSRLEGLMIDAKNFPGWKNFINISFDLRSIFLRHQHIRKIAVVTETKIPSIIPRIASFLVRPEIKQFDYPHKNQALFWLNSRGK